jgi:hypothetical protein
MYTMDYFINAALVLSALYVTFLVVVRALVATRNMLGI